MLNLSQRQNFDPSNFQIPGIRAEAICQVRVLDFISFSAALILSHLEFAYLYQKIYLDHFLQALQSLATNSQHQIYLPYWSNFIYVFKTEGICFLDEKSTNEEFLNELKGILLACNVEMKADRLNIFNSSLILARIFSFTVEIMNFEGRNIIINSVGTDMCIHVFLCDESCSIVYPIKRFYKAGIYYNSKIPDRKFLTLSCGHEVDKDHIEFFIEIGEKYKCIKCNRNLYDQEEKIIRELAKIQQNRARAQESIQNRVSILSWRYEEIKNTDFLVIDNGRSSPNTTLHTEIDSSNDYEFKLEASKNNSDSNEDKDTQRGLCCNRCLVW